MIVLPILLLVIWKPPGRTPRTTADRIAWTIFALGISLMATMVLYAAARESDGDFRTWETIRLHSRLFVAISMIPIAGPLIVYLIQSVRERRSRPLAKKAPVDDWDAEPPFGTGV